MNPTTGRRDLVVPRWVPLVHLFAFQGIDLTGADFLAAVRQVPDGSGAPLISLTTQATLSAQGLKLSSVATETVDFGGGIGELSVPVSYVQMRINETTIEGLDYPEELLQGQRGDDVLLYWDMQITPSGGDKYRALEGKFLVAAGVTGSS